MLSVNIEFWLAFGTGKHFRYLAAHKIAAGLGPERSLALPMFHALTGCDTVSSFVGHGKKTAWAVWNSFPNLTNVLLQMATAPDKIQDECLRVVERFVILLYDKTSTITDVNKARKKLFAKTCNFGSKDTTHARMLHYSNMLRGPSIKVDMFGVMCFVQIPRSLLQIIGDVEKDRLWDLSTILDHH